MALGRPDPSYTYTRKAASSFALAFRIAAVSLGVLWSVFIIDEAFGLNLGRFGLRPGSIPGLVGVITAPLLHGSFQHILSNTLPFFISLIAMLFLYPRASVLTIPGIWIGSGIFAWVIGRPSLHYGASGLIYGMLAYVFLAGLIRRDLRSVSVSMMVAFLYGTMIWGVLPIRPHMSWEMHLGGALMGILFALIYRNSDRLPIKRYDWEDDDSVPEWYPESDDEAFDLADRPPPKSLERK
jgi:membrane associated rhomboid family serine protease